MAGQPWLSCASSEGLKDLALFRQLFFVVAQMRQHISQVLQKQRFEENMSSKNTQSIKQHAIQDLLKNWSGKNNKLYRCQTYCTGPVILEAQISPVTAFCCFSGALPRLSSRKSDASGSPAFLKTVSSYGSTTSKAGCYQSKTEALTVILSKAIKIPSSTSCICTHIHTAELLLQIQSPQLSFKYSDFQRFNLGPLTLDLSNT